MDLEYIIGAQLDSTSLSELETTQTRLETYILPNHPEGDGQERVMDEATCYQWLHERSDAARHIIAISPRLLAYNAGNYSVRLNSSYQRRDELFVSGLSAITVSLLMNAGLLYRGVRATT